MKKLKWSMQLLKFLRCMADGILLDNIIFYYKVSKLLQVFEGAEYFFHCSLDENDYDRAWASK